MGTTLLEKVNSVKTWYHKIELPDDITTPGWAPIKADAYGIPDDMTGMRVLDVGSWDGYWTWEALKRGAAEVVAIDDFSDTAGLVDLEDRRGWESFDICREALGFDIYSSLPSPDAWANKAGQICRRIDMSVYDLSEDDVGRFDVVFCFGVLYHLRHLLLGLDKMTALCDGAIYIESAICDKHSPYQGGMNHGYDKKDMVMEFYPDSQYGANPSNWWVPTLQCLGAMVIEAGFKDVQAWYLTPDPSDVASCRGFVCGTRDVKTHALSVPAIAKSQVSDSKPPLKIAAIMSVPRLGFMDNFGSVFQALQQFNVPLSRVQGAFWGQCLERGMMELIDQGYDIILTMDYDTVFGPDDFAQMAKLMYDHDEADAIVAIQMGRQMDRPLLTIRGKSGRLLPTVPLDSFESEVTKIASGHFGLTMLRVSSLVKMPHPWFIPSANPEGLWGEGRIDEDIAFWNNMREHDMTVYSANRIVLGHLELMVTWPGVDCKPVHQHHSDYHKDGKPENIWK